MSLVASSNRAVQNTLEVQRIHAIPRRIWTDAEAQTFAVELSAVLRKARGQMSLRPIQAQALLEAGTQGGLFGPIRVGGGKTLLSLLLPYVLDSRRPLLILPAKLIEKTKREMRELAEHWPIPNFIRIVSYEILGRAGHAELLEKYEPDLIVADECHKLKSPKAAVTKRVSRFMNAHPGVRFAAISGTITTRSVKDYAHILRWCLDPGRCPLPNSWSELEDWSDALDEKTSGENTCDPGFLLSFSDAEEIVKHGRLTAARIAVRRRLTDTPGVVATREIHDASCTLTLQALMIDTSNEVERAFTTLREDWTTPDGWPISDPMTLWRHARELALGFYYRWDPRPPDAWLFARKDWSAMCREILSSNRRNLDSELQVTNAVDQGLYPEALPLLTHWRSVKDTFEPNTVPVWLDDSVIKACNLWATREPGIVWTEHRAFAVELSRVSHLQYYGRLGLNSQSRPIEKHDTSESMIASVASNSEGRNLQHWSRGLVVSPPPNGRIWEQLLGRMHRDGQRADEVTYEPIVSCLEHVTALHQAIADAHYIEHSTGQAQKLIYADKIIPYPEDIEARPGYRWHKKEDRT
jgi:hypothetical protein